jgi:hypothetical protein
VDREQNKKRLTSLVRFSLLIALVLFVWPVKYQTTRALFVLLVAIILIGWLARCWSVPKLKWPSLVVIVIPLTFLLLPGRPVDSIRVRERYTNSLRSFVGARYVWGGENWLGTDCSGLVRRGLINALLKEGVVTLNPRTVRTSLYLWWNDTSAQALQKRYLRMTDTIASSLSLNSFDHVQLLPGDLAVTANGVHIMAYLGDEQWIEADPAFGEVVILRKGDDDEWLQTDVELLRWRWLE